MDLVWRRMIICIGFLDDIWNGMFGLCTMFDGHRMVWISVSKYGDVILVFVIQFRVERYMFCNWYNERERPLTWNQRTSKSDDVVDLE